MSHSQEQEVEQNYDFFQRNLAQWMPDFRGQFALLRDRKLIRMYESFADAYRAGLEEYSDARFSVQEVSDEPVDLGAASFALT